MSKQKKITLLKKEKVLFDKLSKLVHAHPYFVVIILHEYFRNIFPSDPHIKFKTNDPVKRISMLFDSLDSIIDLLLEFGNYKLNWTFLLNFFSSFE